MNRVEINKITEVFPGHFQLILNFPSAKILNSLLNDEFKFVWVLDHVESFEEWKRIDFNIFGVHDLLEREARNIRMEYLMKTQEFKETIDNINQTITLCQINRKPPSYLDLKRLTGASRYNLLKDKVNYLFEITIPFPEDYCTIISSSFDFLESFLKNADVDNLP